MTIRYKIKCNTCNRKILLKVGMGYTEYQKYTFECDCCSSNIEFGIKAQPPTASIEYIKNCSQDCFNDKEDYKNESYLTKSFHQDLLIVDELTHFSNISEMSKIHKKRYSIRNQEVCCIMNNFIYIKNNWCIIEQAWKMKNNNKHDFIANVLDKYESNTIEKGNGFEHILFDFNNSLLAPEFLIYKDFAKKIIEQYKSKKTKKKEFEKLMQYYEKELLVVHMEKFLNIYKEFFELYDDFRPLLIYSRLGAEIELYAKVSSDNFDKTKMFYGKLYEDYMSNIVFISLIHNISNGRKYNEFCSMTLEQYLGFDKSSRTTNFKDTQNFSFFDEFLTNKLRNASHHGNIRITKNNIVEYQSGKGVLKKYTMSYTRYLQICVELFLRFVCLLQCEILFYYNYTKTIKK